MEIGYGSILSLALSTRASRERNTLIGVIAIYFAAILFYSAPTVPHVAILADRVVLSRENESGSL